MFARSTRYNEFGLYITDAWKVFERLTQASVCGTDYFGVQHNKDPKLDSNYYQQGPTSTNKYATVQLAPDSPIGELWKEQSTKNFGPKIGFAYDVKGDGKTVRGG